MAQCKACAAQIIWKTTKSGKSLPCNADPVFYRENPQSQYTVVTYQGKVVKADIMPSNYLATGLGYIPHWATCPKADQFRKKGVQNGGQG